MKAPIRLNNFKITEADLVHNILQPKEVKNEAGVYKRYCTVCHCLIETARKNKVFCSVKCRNKSSNKTRDNKLKDLQLKVYQLQQQLKEIK